MPTNIEIDEVQSNLRDIIAGLSPDDEVVITDNARPVAKLTLDGKRTSHRPPPGLCKGMITIVDDNDDHLTDFGITNPSQ